VTGKTGLSLWLNAVGTTTIDTRFANFADVKFQPGATSAYSGVVSGIGSSLTKDGAGALTLSGTNTYTGATTVNAGTLAAGVPSVPGVSGAFGNNSAVTLVNAPGATLDITGFNTQIGSITGGGGAGGNVTLGAATLTIGGDGTSPVAYAGVISGTGGIAKIGASMLTLSGTNTYSGVTTISGGTLSVGTLANGGTDSNIGASSNAAANLVLDGGTLQYTGAGVSTDRLFTLTNNGGTIDASAAVRSISPT
jgi:autotransporter-associated beta strand protein